MFKTVVPVLAFLFAVPKPGRRFLLRYAIIAALTALAIPAAAAPLDRQTRQRLPSGIAGESLLDAFDHADRVPVMVMLRRSKSRERGAARAAARSARESVMRSLTRGELEVSHTLDSIAALAGTITADGLQQLSAHPAVERIDLDDGGTAHLAEAVPLVRLDVARELGFTGNGVVVAVLDSGIDTDHPDLAASLIAQHCICGTPENGCCPDGTNEQDGPGSAEDGNGHGTNVTGVVTSDGIVAPIGGAPDTQVVAVRVLDDRAVFATSAQVVAGLDWILEERLDVRVVNMSLGTNARFEGDCGHLDPPNSVAMAFARAIDALTERGVLVVASSGNQRSGIDMPAPACVANSLSVGAVFDSDLGTQSFPSFGCTDLTTAADQVTCFSNSNETTNVFAPGSRMTSAGRGGGTSTFSGTSQAAPTVVACAAALLEADPTLEPSQLELLLEVSTTMVTDATNGLSFPRIDCEQSLAAVGQLPPTPTRSATPTRTATLTATSTRTPTPSPTSSHTGVPSPTATGRICEADCDRDGGVTITDVLLAVSIALGNSNIDDCRSIDNNMDGTVTVNELVLAVGQVLSSCRQAG